MSLKNEISAKTKCKAPKHQPGILKSSLINRAVRTALAPGKVDVSGNLDEQHEQINLAKHCVMLAQSEMGPQVISVSDLLEWTFELIAQGVSEFYWCRIADALYSLSLFMVNEIPDDAELRRLCDQLYKSRHEYQQCRRFLEEQHVRERLGLESEDLMKAAGFMRSSRREHLRRARQDKRTGQVAATDWCLRGSHAQI